MQTRISATLIATALAALCGAAPLASAQEYCVTCTSPDATYRCIVESKPDTAVPTGRGQLLCITELARSGNHASCKVGRSTTGPCTGEPRTVMFTRAADEALPPIGEPPKEASQPSEAATAEGAPAPPGTPPQTVEELAKDTVEASGKGLKKAGEAVTDTAKSTGKAVGNAVSKTWKCVTSLFSDC